MKDWVKEWYNDQFDKIDISPSSSVWENISRTMEDWPKHWYNANATDLGTKPRQTTWENLQQHLAHQNNVGLANRFSYALASVVALVLLVIPFRTDDDLYRDSSPSQLSFLANSFEKGSTSDRLGSREFIVANDSQQSSTVQVYQGLQRNTSVSSIQSTPVDGLSQIEFDRIKVGNNVKEIDFNATSDDLVETMSLPILNRNESQFDRKLVSRNHYSIKGNWIGVSMSPQFSTLNNPMAQFALSSENEDISLRPSITYAFSAGRNFNERNGMKLALLLNNRKSLSTYSQMESKSISLNYISVAALYTSSWKLGNSGRFRFNTEAGLIAGISSAKNVMFDDERIDYLEEGYGDFDAGVMVGASISAALTRNWSINAGLTSQIGLMNIFKGSDQIPADYFKTNTQAVGLRLGLSRSF